MIFEKKYVHELTCLSRFLAGRVMTKGLLLEWKENLIGRYAPASVSNKLAAVNGFLAFCGLEKLRMRKLKVQKNLFLSEEKELTKAEYIRLVKAAERKANERLSLVIQTICATGSGSVSCVLSRLRRCSAVRRRSAIRECDGRFFCRISCGDS